MKRKKKSKVCGDFVYFLTLALVIVISPIAVIFGMAKSYEAIRANGFAERVSAIGISDEDENIFRFFDNEIDLEQEGGDSVEVLLRDIIIAAKKLYDSQSG